MTSKGARRLRHAADGPAASRPPGRRARQLAPLQEQYDCFYFVADWHALTSDLRRHEPADVGMRTRTSPTGSAPGLDPEKSTFFVQSLVPEHAELYLLLSMVVPVPWLERVPTYKEQQENLEGQGSVVDRVSRLPAAADRRRGDVRRDASFPVGEDQVAHLELAREAVRALQQLLRRRPRRAAAAV